MKILDGNRDKSAESGKSVEIRVETGSEPVAAQVAAGAAVADDDLHVSEE